MGEMMAMMMMLKMMTNKCWFLYFTLELQLQSFTFTFQPGTLIHQPPTFNFKPQILAFSLQPSALNL